MTVGSWNRDNYTLIAGGWSGVKWARSWNGADRPKVAKSPPIVYYYWDTVDVLDRWKGRIIGTRSVLRRRRIRKWGWSNPALLKRQRNVDHPYTMSDRYMSDELATFYVGCSGPGYTQSGSAMSAVGIGAWAAVNLLDPNDQINLVNKLSEKLKGSDFNMSVFLGEGHQALQMIGDSAIRIAKALYHIRKGDVGGATRSLFEGTTRKPLKVRPSRQPGLQGAKQALKTPAQNWLELQYGWLPLLKDAEAGAQALAHYLNVPATLTYRVSRLKEVGYIARSGPFTNCGITNYFSAPVLQSHRRSIIARISEPPTVPQLLGLLDPELVAWELLPFSFVIDWFIPIGSYLEARAFASRLTGVFVTSDKMLGDVGVPSGTYITPVRCRWTDVVFTRSISSSLQVPMPNFKGLDKIASWRHCANAVALLVGMK